MKVILVDDDKEFYKLFKESFERQTDKLNLSANLFYENNINSLLESEQEYDVYLIDIEMPQISGIDLVGLLRKCHVDKEFIFISSHEGYMQRSIFAKPSGFIRKQHLEEDLFQVILMLKNQMQKSEGIISFREGKNQVAITLDKVLYCTSEGHYVDFCMTDGTKQFFRVDMKKIEAELELHDFIRIHVRYVVNLKYVAHFTRDEIVMLNKQRLPVGKTYKTRIKGFMMRWFRNREMEQ